MRFGWVILLFFLFLDLSKVFTFCLWPTILASRASHGCSVLVFSSMGRMKQESDLELESKFCSLARSAARGQFGITPNSYTMDHGLGVLWRSWKRRTWTGRIRPESRT